MTEKMLIVFGVLAVAVGLFAWGRLRADIVAILVVLAVGVSVAVQVPAARGPAGPAPAALR